MVSCPTCTKHLEWYLGSMDYAFVFSTSSFRFIVWNWMVDMKFWNWMLGICIRQKCSPSIHKISGIWINFLTYFQLCFDSVSLWLHCQSTANNFLGLSFPHIVSTATILFWKLWCGNHSKEETIQGRKLLISCFKLQLKPIDFYCLWLLQLGNIA